MAWTALALVALLGCALATFAYRRNDGPTADWVVEPVRLLAPAEQQLYAQLRLAFPHHLVLTQVALPKLLRLRRSRGSPAIFQRYARMAAPFVVCTNESMPLIVFDVHATRDVPRPSREQQQRAALLQASGLVYLSVAAVAGTVPSADDLRQRVRAALHAKPGRGAAPAARSRVAARNAAAPASSLAVGVRRVMRPLLALRGSPPERHAKVA